MFTIPDRPHSLRCTCCTGGERSLLLLPVYSAMMELDPELALKVMRDDGEDTQTDGETPSPKDPWYRDELALAALLGAFWLAGIKNIKPILDGALVGTYDKSKLDDALAQANATMGNLVTGNDAVKLSQQIDQLIIIGAQQVRGAGSATGAGITNHVGPTTVGKGTILEDSPSAKQVLDGVANAAGYYTNNHFNTQVIPAIQRDIAAMLADHTGLHKPDLAPIRDALDKRLASVPYWRLVANAAASRAFHYGVAKSGQLTRATSYTWDSIIDNKTSAICISLNGRTFQLADAVNLMERAAAASPAQQRTIMPWPTREQTAAIPDMTNAQLRDLGFIVPPAHGNCRSTISLNYR